MSHVYLQELQSGPSHVASSTHSIQYMIFVQSQQRASHYKAPFYSLPSLTICFVKSHFRA